MLFGIVGSHVSSQTVAPFESFATFGAHVLAGLKVSVHVRGEVLLEPGRILAHLTFEDNVAGPLGLLSLLGLFDSAVVLVQGGQGASGAPGGQVVVVVAVVGLLVKAFS